MKPARITCGNSTEYDPALAPGCMPVCDACLQKWLDAKGSDEPRARSFPDIVEP